MKIFVIKINDRYFSKYENKRLSTAWSLAGVKMFRDNSTDARDVEKLLANRKIKWQIVYLQEVETLQEEEPDLATDLIRNKLKKWIDELPDDNTRPDYERKLLSFSLKELETISITDILCVVGYRETGNKFRVSFNGSKGYLSHLEIACEGQQKAENRIFLSSLRNKNRSFKNVLVNVFYSPENGIRLSTGQDFSRKIRFATCAEAAIYAGENNDLPF